MVQRQNKRGAFRGRSAIDDLLELAVAAEAADRQNGAAVHGEQQRRAVQKCDRETMERVVEQIAVADRERSRPIQMRENAERHRLAEAAHQHRTDDARAPASARSPTETPRRRACPCSRARARRYMRSHHSSTERGQEKARHEPPSAVLQPRKMQAVRRRRRLERQPGQLADELHRIPMHRREHVESDDLEGDEAADQATDSPVVPR